MTSSEPNCFNQPGRRELTGVPLLSPVQFSGEEELSVILAGSPRSILSPTETRSPVPPNLSAPPQPVKYQALLQWGFFFKSKRGFCFLLQNVNIYLKWTYWVTFVFPQFYCIFSEVSSHKGRNISYMRRRQNGRQKEPILFLWKVSG